LELDIDKAAFFASLGQWLGNTTLIKTILGMVIPNKGTISVMAFKRSKISEDICQDINYLPQIAISQELKVKELIAMIKDIAKTH